MNTRTRLHRAFDNPILFLRQINRLYHQRFGRRGHNTNGVDVFAEDWDTLAILDACRYDMFARCSNLPGRLERRQSKGSATAEFLTANFDGRDLRDTVYVTANPQLYRNRESIAVDFHDVIHVWREEGWDEEYGTVLPETVTEYALRAADEYPNKRLVVHYMQPHYPFIGSETDFDKGHLTGARQENVWNQLLLGTLTAEREDVWSIYEANLERALPHAETLLENLDGRTVVTADHGNMVGERAFPLPIREWGHPRGIYTTELVSVPWLVHESGPRREIRAGGAESQSKQVTDEVVADRLRQLGYAE